MSRIASPRRQPHDQRIPPLENGDRLTRDEFERRYNAMPDCIKAELIEGIVHMAPPALRFDDHGAPHADLMGWLGVYRASTPGVRVGDNSSIRLDMTNMPQPDAAMIVIPEFGGQATVTPDGYLSGAPELVAEIAASSVSIDLNEKLRAYRRNGVKEYIVWRTQDQMIDWFELNDGRYLPLSPNADGILRSRAFPGLWRDATAMVRGQLDGVLEVLQQGLASPEHAAFRASLKAR
jgi:hypothetical protein